MYKTSLFLLSLFFSSFVLAEPAVNDSTTTGSITIQAGELNVSGSSGRIVYDRNMYNGARTVPFCGDHRCRYGTFYISVSGTTGKIYDSRGRVRGTVKGLTPQGALITSGTGGAYLHGRGLHAHPSYPNSVFLMNNGLCVMGNHACSNDHIVSWSK